MVGAGIGSPLYSASLPVQGIQPALYLIKRLLLATNPRWAAKVTCYQIYNSLYLKSVAQLPILSSVMS